MIFGHVDCLSGVYCYFLFLSSIFVHLDLYDGLTPLASKGCDEVPWNSQRKQQGEVKLRVVL